MQHDKKKSNLKFGFCFLWVVPILIGVVHASHRICLIFDVFKIIVTHPNIQDNVCPNRIWDV
jgi:hypothetical protein